MDYCIGFVLLLILSLLAHGFWVLMRMLYRAVAGERTPPPVAESNCKNCGYPRVEPRARCPSCELTPREARRAYENQIVRRYLRGWNQEQELDNSAFEHLMQLLARPHHDRPENVPATAAPIAPQAEILEVVPVAPEPSPVAPALAEPSPPRPAPMPEPEPRVRRGLGHWLAAFMEQRNILWGELIGGLLMVGCSVALVISLWQSLEEIPFFPFLILAAITVALFGAGRYTLTHWRLATTSLGLLGIATLMVPLDFLVLAGLSSGREGPIGIAVKVAAIVSFALLIRMAGHYLYMDRPNDSTFWRMLSDRRLLMLAVLGGSAVAVPAPRFLAWETPEWGMLAWLAGVPVVSHALTIGLAIGRRRYETPSPMSLLGLVGLATFPLALTLGFAGLWMTSRGLDTGLVRAALAVAITVSAAVVQHAGLTAQRSASGGLAVATTAVVLAGALVQMIGLVLAWPNPSLIVAVALIDYVAFTVAAGIYRIPPLHMFALPCVSLASVLGYHLVVHGDTIDNRTVWILRHLTIGETGPVLAGIGVVFTCIADRLRRPGLRSHGMWYLGGFAVASAFALIITGMTGIAFPARAAATAGSIVIVALLLEYRWGETALGHAAAFLLTPTALGTLHAVAPGEYPLWGTAFAGLALALFAARERWWPAALVAGGVPFVLAIVRTTPAPAAWDSASLGLLAAAMFLEAVRRRQVVLAWAGSMLALFGIGAACFVADVRSPLMPDIPLLAHASLILALATIARRFERSRALTRPLATSADIGTFAAAAAIASNFAGTEFTMTSALAGWLAGVWLFKAIDRCSAEWFGGFQAALSVSAVAGVAATLHDNGLVHFITSASPLYAYGLALMLLSGVWVGLRILLGPRALFDPRWPAVDRVMLGLLIAGQLVVAIARVGPQIVNELAPAGVSALAWLDDAAAPPWLVWANLATSGLVLFGARWDARTANRRVAVAAGMMALAVTAAALACNWFADQRASASMLRWGIAVAFAAASIPFWARQSSLRLAVRLRVPTVATPAEARDSLRQLRALLLIIGAVPLAITAVTIIGFLQGSPPSGPIRGSFFHRLGLVMSHGLSMGLVAAALVGHGIRERRAIYAFAAGVIVQFLVAGGFGVGIVLAKRSFDALTLVQMSLRVAMTGAVWALVWLASVTTWRRLRHLIRPRRSVAGWWDVQLGLTTIVMALPLIATAIQIAGPVVTRQPHNPHGYGILPNWCGQVVGISGGLALGLTMLSGAMRSAVTRRTLTHLVGAGGLAVVVFVAVHASELGPHWGYWLLMLGWAGCSVEWSGRVGRQPGARGGLDVWTFLTGMLSVLLAIKAVLFHNDPLPAATTLALVGFAMAWLASVRRQTAGLVVSLFLFAIAGMTAVVAWRPGDDLALAAGAIIGMALAVSFWVWLDRLMSAPIRLPAMAVVGVLLAFIMTIAFVLPPSTHDSPWPLWIALGSTLGAVVAGWRDPSPRYAPPMLYVTALAAIGTGMLHAKITREHLGMTVAGSLAIFTLIAQIAGQSWRRTEPVPSWFRSAQFVVGVVSIVFGVAVLGMDSFWQRAVSPAGTLLLIPAAAMLANRGRGWMNGLTYLTLWLGVIAVAEALAARIAPDASAVALRRMVAVLAGLTAGTVGYGFGAGRLPGRWSPASRRLAPLLGLAGFAVVAIVLGMQSVAYDKILKSTPLSTAEVAIVAIAIAGLIVAALTFVIRPWTDPFGLPDRYRPAYVYAAELLLVFLFLNIRLNVPWLFPPVSAKAWAFIIMGIAFLGVGLAEMLKRLRLPMLAGPLERTGLFLPALPLLMFWLKPPAAIRDRVGDAVPGMIPLLSFFDQIPTDFGGYAALWLLAGLLYSWLAFVKRSYAHALVASLSTTFALWAYWEHSNVAFVIHPQLWLIPVALIVLASERHHRERLRPDLAATLRYVGLGTLYLSSTADLFLTRLGESVVLPIALALLSIMGILAGIVLQLRAYLFLGTGFLILTIFSMIWHAAVDRGQTWIWWASGVVLGAAILILFALFERRRDRMKEVLDEMRHWR
jgi:hypothetical protein